jgi:hypothetical protein
MDSSVYFDSKCTQIDGNMSIYICVYILNVISLSKLLGVHMYTHVHMLGPPLSTGRRTPGRSDEVGNRGGVGARDDGGAGFHVVGDLFERGSSRGTAAAAARNGEHRPMAAGALSRAWLCAPRPPAWSRSLATVGPIQPRMWLIRWR